MRGCAGMLIFLMPGSRDFLAAWDVSVFAGMTVSDGLRYDLIP